MKYSEIKLSQGNCVHRNFHTACTRSDPGSAGCQALSMGRTSKQLVHNLSS